MVKSPFKRVKTSIRIKKGLFPRFLAWCKNQGYGSTCYPLEAYMEGCLEGDNILTEEKKGGNVIVKQYLDRIVQKPRRYGKLRKDKDRVFLKEKGSSVLCLKGCGPSVIKVCHVIEDSLNKDSAENLATEFLCEKCFHVVKKRPDFWKGKYWFKDTGVPYSF